MTQIEKANVFKALHKTGNPLVLYNIWDAGGAKVLEGAGTNAIATGSWSMAAAHGFEDGESIPLDFVLRIVERITRTVDLPVSIDLRVGMPPLRRRWPPMLRRSSTQAQSASTLKIA